MILTMAQRYELIRVNPELARWWVHNEYTNCPYKNYIRKHNRKHRSFKVNDTQTQTPFMRADEIANAFNSVTERKHWKARVSGTRQRPTVNFNSTTAMVGLIYSLTTERWQITFSKVSCAFGDYMASAYSSLMQVLLCLKACGFETDAPLGATDGALRLEFDPVTKETNVAFARLTDDWSAFDGDGFKVQEINVPQSNISA